MQGGVDLSELKPLGPDGNVEPDPDGTEVMGCLQAHLSILNIRGAQPGYFYFYGRMKPSPDVMEWQMRGAEIVQAGDPEYLGEHVDARVAAALDSTQAYNDVVLMRWRIGNPDEPRTYSAFRALENRKADLQLNKAAHEFIDRASDVETTNYSNRGPTRFARPDHRVWRDDF